ncbi:MAG TPA: MBL fold metallo-hydrolase [Acidimicrobiia bacterium]|nr:MBL fold metallo-hydrolase [Acidimicrobiia bacterium]
MRLTEHVYLVGSGAASGFGLSGELDSHIYLIDGGTELALVDCGMGDSFEQVMANVASDGLDRSRIRHLTLTHYHADHAGGASRFREELGVAVHAAAAAAAALSSGDEEATGLSVAKRAGFYPADYHFDPCPVDDEMSDGDRLAIGDLLLRVLETPGHCSGHLCFMLETPDRRHLFSGDCVFAGGRILLQSIPDCDIGAYATSIGRLAAEDFEALLPGHGIFTVRGGKRHIETANEGFKRLFLPPNLV